METKVDSNRYKYKSYFTSIFNIVTDFDNGFLELTGYSKEEIEDKEISFVFTKLLRLPEETYKRINFKSRTECFIFTKTLEAREVTISLLKDPISKAKVYIVEEKPNSRLEEKLLFEAQVFLDNKIGCGIYSVPDLKLLKSNQKLQDLKNFLFNKKENIIGKYLKEIATDCEKSEIGEIFKRILETKKSYSIKEFRFDNYSGDIAYWDSTLTPIFVNGEMKYIYENTADVTKQVLNKQKHEALEKDIKLQNIKLKQQNELLRKQANLLNLSNEAIFAWDLKGVITYWNKGAEQMYGYDSNEALGYKCNDLLKTVRYGISADIISILEKVGVWNGEVEQTCKDGEKLIIETSKQIVLDELGQITILETNRDMTEIKKLEKALLFKNAQLESIIENTFDGLIVADKEGKIKTINTAARKMFSQFSKINKAGEITKVNLFTDMDGCPVPIDQMPLNRALRGEIVNNFRMISKKAGNENIMEVNATPIYQNNDFMLAIASMHDITDLIKIQNELKYRKELFETVIENMSEAFAVFDNKGNLLIKNAEARNIYPELGILNTVENSYNALEYFDLEGKKKLIEDLPIQKALRGEAVKNDVIVIKLKDKDQVIEVNATPIFDRNNVLVSIASFHRDITEGLQNQWLIKYQQELMLLQEKENNEVLKREIEMKDEFLSLISHEFKTPLTVINSAIQAMELLCKSELSEKAKGFLNKIRQNSNRQLKLVNNLLDITRMKTGYLKNNRTEIDIVFFSKFITDSITLYAEQKGIRITFSTSLRKKLIWIDKEKYERILLNLLSNAVKFTPKGKSVAVKVYQKIVNGKCKVCIEVTDKGVGIPEDKKSLIFERFGQVDNSLSRQAEGTGIGLYLVKMLVELLDGEILLESKVDVGSKFIVRFPIEKCKGSPGEPCRNEINDLRLIPAMNIEFSDI